MALTGTIETEEGALHEFAYGMCKPFVADTYPNPTAKFDFCVWHDLQYMLDGKKQITGFPISFSVSGEQLFEFAAAAKSAIMGGDDVIPAIVEQMQAVVKADKDFIAANSTPEQTAESRFAAWTETA